MKDIYLVITLEHIKLYEKYQLQLQWFTTNIKGK